MTETKEQLLVKVPRLNDCPKMKHKCSGDEIYVVGSFYHEEYKVHRYLIASHPFELPRDFGVMDHELEIIPPKEIAPLPDPQRLHPREEMEDSHSAGYNAELGEKARDTFERYYSATFPSSVTHRDMDADERIKWWGEQEKPSEMEFKYLKEHEMSTRNYWQISNSIDINTTHYRPTPDSDWIELPKVEV